MATVQEDLPMIFISTFLFLVLLSSCGAQLLSMCKLDSKYQLGDSLADNLIIENPMVACSRFPYGETFFNSPTGRCFNGLLMIDYVALEAGIPFLNPYLKNGSDFSYGVNFAVSGATALSASYLAAKGQPLPSPTVLLVYNLIGCLFFFSSAFQNDTGSLFFGSE